MCQDGQGFSLTVLSGEPVEVSCPWLIAFEEKDGCLAEGPLEMGVADLLTACAVRFTVGFFPAFDQAAVGDEILDRWETLDGFNLIEDDKAQDSADAGDGFEQGIGHRIVMVGHGDDITLHFCYDGIIGLNDCKIRIDHLLNRGIFKAFGDARTVLGFGDTSQEIVEVVLAPGILYMGIEFCTFSHEMIPSPEQIPGCSHFGRVGIGHGDHASPEQDRDLVGIDLVVFGLAAVDGFHVQGVTEDKGDTMLFTEIGDPVPGEHAFHRDHNILPEGFYDLEEDFAIGFDVSVQSDLPCFIEDAEIHFFGMKVDSAIKFVLFSVKSHGLPPFLWLMVLW